MKKENWVSCLDKKSSIEDTFILMCELSDINKIDDREFRYKTKKYEVDIVIDKAYAKAFGGKKKAYKITLYSKLICLICSFPEGAGLMDDSLEPVFKEIAMKYPLLRSDYECAKIGTGYNACITYWNLSSR